MLLGNTSILKLGGFLKQDECLSIILKFLDLKTCTCKHLQFMVMKNEMAGSGIALELNCNLSGVETFKLFQKSDIDLQTLEAVVKLGAKIKLKSVEEAVKHISDNKILVLRFAVSACDPKLECGALTSLCTKALSLRKPDLSAFLISEGAKPDNANIINAVDTKMPNEGLVSFLLSTSDGCSYLLLHAITTSALALAEQCLGDSALVCSEMIDLGKLMKSSRDLLCQNPELLENLFKAGVNPDGLSDDNRPIDAILALPKDFHQKARLLCLLAEHHADFTKATYPRSQGTTILHIATEMAIEHRK